VKGKGNQAENIFGGMGGGSVQINKKEEKEQIIPQKDWGGKKKNLLGQYRGKKHPETNCQKGLNHRPEKNTDEHPGHEGRKKIVGGFFTMHCGGRHKRAYFGSFSRNKGPGGAGGLRRVIMHSGVLQKKKYRGG